jgi:hypothetical protein
MAGCITELFGFRKVFLRGIRENEPGSWRAPKWCRRKVAISVSLQMDARTFRRSARALPGGGWRDGFNDI